MAGMNITGYEIIVPYIWANSADTRVRAPVRRLPKSDPMRNMTKSIIMPPYPGT